MSTNHNSYPQPPVPMQPSPQGQQVFLNNGDPQYYPPVPDPVSNRGRTGRTDLRPPQPGGPVQGGYPPYPAMTQSYPRRRPDADPAPAFRRNEPFKGSVPWQQQMPRTGTGGSKNPRSPEGRNIVPPPKKKRSKRSIFVNVLCLFLAVVVGLVGSAMVYAGSMFARIGTGMELQEDDFQGINGNVSFELDSAMPGNDTLDEAGEISTTSTLRSDPMVQNILLLGSDKREGKGETGWRADTIIILSIDRRHKTLKLTSILRDTYVSIPGYGSDRINAAYSCGGATLMMKTIESNFGIKIDRYATVSFTVFAKIVDIIGGIDLEITAREAGEINRRTKIQPEVSAGFMHLNGRQALEYVRIRKIDDDFVRTSRQRKAMEIILNKMKSSTLNEIHTVLYEALPLIATNHSQEEVLSLVADVSTILQYPMESISIPYSNTWQDKKIRGMAVLAIDMEENRRILGQFIFESGMSKYYGYTYSGYTYGYGYGDGYGYGYFSTRPAEDSPYSSEGPQSKEAPDAASS